MRYDHVLYFFIAMTVMISCGRKTSDENTEPVEEITTINSTSDTTLITAEDPFKNQPNELCTVIRKLNINYYSPETVTSDPDTFPKKYCLLDICLELVDPGAMTLDIGEEGEIVTTTCKVIKVFDSYEATKAYADKFGINDVKYEE